MSNNNRTRRNGKLDIDAAVYGEKCFENGFGCGLRRALGIVGGAKNRARAYRQLIRLINEQPMGDTGNG